MWERASVGLTTTVVPGTFVSIEGIEGSGKSTLLSALSVRLQARGIEVVTTREPGGTPLGDALRATFVRPGLAIDPIAEAMIVSASRAQHVAEIIEPALARGVWVLCDRFAHATLAYQGYGRGVDLEVLRSLERIATRGRTPDVTFLVDIDVVTSRERVARRAANAGDTIDRLEREGAAFHERVRDGYLALATVDSRIVTLDGSLTPDALLALAESALAARA